MSKRRTADEVTRLLKDADRDLAKGMTVSDFCRKVGVAQTTYHRWRKRHDPKQVDSDRRCRQLEVEVERLKTKLGGSEDLVAVALRTTSILRLEGGGWKIVQCHADPITTVQSVESLVQQST